MKKSNVKVDVAVSAGQRRKFLKLSGLALAGTGLLMACDSDDDGMPMQPPADVFDLGTGDLGVLNYAYALEQLEAKFYENVVNGSYWSSLGSGSEERTILQDLYYHEVIHRDFFKTAITAAVDGDTDLVLPTIEFDFSSVDFGNRNSVLNTAKVLEDTGVGAYNGAGRLLNNATYLLLAGKIVSVEARHASAIADLLNPGSAAFAGNDVVTTDNGFGRAQTPQEILSAVIDTNFVVTPFTYKEQGVG